MTQAERLRRVVRLCRSFAWNLSYFREGQKSQYEWLFDGQNPVCNFWNVTRNNFLDMCILEWCKLFGKPRELHHWKKIVAEPKSFEAELLAHVGVDESRFQEHILKTRDYRDKFIAHLDSDSTMMIPMLDIHKKAASFYHAKMLRDDRGDFLGLEGDLESLYEEFELEAAQVYERALGFAV